MPKFTKEQDARLELGKLLNSFKIKIKDAEQSSEAQLKLRLCKEIITEYNESMETLSHMDDYSKRTKRSREVAFKEIKDELRHQLAITKGIYITEQLNQIFDSNNFSTRKEHISTIKEVILFTKTATKDKKEVLKGQIQEAKKLLKELEYQEQEEALVKDTIIDQPVPIPQELEAITQEEAKVILETEVITVMDNEKEKNLANETEEAQITPIEMHPPLSNEVAIGAKTHDLEMLQDLLNKANENDSQVIGRKYFLDFITAHKEQFNALMVNLSEDKKATFIEDMAPLQNLTHADSVKSKVLATMSWVTMPMTVMVRSMAPYMVEQFDSWLPETQDSYCKAQLKKLISETLEDMRCNEATVTQQQKFEAIAPVTLEKEETNKELVALIATQQQKPEVIAPATQEKEELNKEPEAPIVTQQPKPEAIAPVNQEKEKLNKEPEAPIITQQEKPEAIAPANQGKEEIHKEPVAPIATQQQKDQVIVPAAFNKESANKEAEASIKTYQQKFRTIAEEAAQKALDRARLKAQIEHQSKFVPIAQQAATKARAKMLHKQMDKYLTFVEQFAVIVLDLQQKKKHNTNYKNVTQVALNLYGKLKDAALFFEQPSAEGFEVFKQFCNGSINEAESEFKQHRDLWHTIHPILKGILGVVAALTVIPALLVATTRTGYVNTFFKTPETASSKKLHQIREMLESVEDEVEQKIKMQ
ncbi:cell envelope integrity protein TolA [Legionella sainthelensi]|uniref:cell envelope integrity protein TolA n=1 Tax=Legionella sainthelensi TaxID=28087 RepID=UPI000E201A73|nr:cell envelope integrity protein TolA [Legionella sainthelensi]